MGLLNSIGSALSSAFETVSRIGGEIAKTVAKIAPVIEPLLARVHPVLAIAVRVIAVVGHILNVLKPDETVEDIGDRALQAAEQDDDMRPECFTDYEEYLDAIRSVDLDPVKTEQNKKDNSATIAGLATVGKGLEEKYNLNVGGAGDLLKATLADPDFFNSERLANLIENGSDFGEIVNYLEGKSSISQTETLYEKLYQQEQKINPSANREAFDESVYEAKQKGQDIL